MREQRRIRTAVGIALVAGALQGCAAIPLALVAAPLLNAGGDVVVKAGTEYSASGAVYRTFNLPMEHMRWAVREAFTRSQVAVTLDDDSPTGDRIAGTLYSRTVDVEILPLTPVLSLLQMVVKRNFLASDKATASLLLANIEKLLQPEPAPVVASDEAPPPVRSRGK